MFLNSSTCFERHTAHHQELKNMAEWPLSHDSCRQPQTYVKPEGALTVFELLMMSGMSLETCWAINHDSCQQPQTYVKPEGALTVFELLMMSGMSLETCWAINHDSCQQPQTYVKPESALTVFELLMMSGVSLETCWAINHDSCQQPQTYVKPEGALTVFELLMMSDMSLEKCWAINHDSCRQPQTYVKPEGALTVFELLMMSGMSLETCWAINHDSCQQPQTYVKPEGAITVFELLMMSCVSLETCWAIKKHWINKFYYTVASCWLFLYDLYYDVQIHEHHVWYYRFARQLTDFLQTTVQFLLIWKGLLKCTEWWHTPFCPRQTNISGVRKEHVEKENMRPWDGRKFEKMRTVRFAPSKLVWSRDIKLFFWGGGRGLVRGPKV